MTRTASGTDHIEAAREQHMSVRRADELRLAQSVLLPLELGLSIEQTTQAISPSPGATCTMCPGFGKVQSREMAAQRNKRHLRNSAYTRTGLRGGDSRRGIGPCRQ